MLQYFKNFFNFIVINNAKTYNILNYICTKLKHVDTLDFYFESVNQNKYFVLAVGALAPALSIREAGAAEQCADRSDGASLKSFQ